MADGKRGKSSFRRLVDFVRWETRKTVRDPGRVKLLLDPRKVSALVKRARNYERKFGARWTDTDDGLRVRSYPSYEAYVGHQRAKLQTLDLKDDDAYDTAFSSALRARLPVAALGHGATALCLGARRGTEVRTLLEFGCFAIGVDLNPGAGNRYVVSGDFHNLQFPDAAVDLVYTNSLDHALDIARVIAEIKRVVKPGGTAIVEAGLGTAEGGGPGEFESFHWSSVDDLLALFEAQGFTLLKRTTFEIPWRGEQLLLTRP